MPITNAELSKHQRPPVDEQRGGAARGAGGTTLVAMRLPTPYVKKPAEKRKQRFGRSDARSSQGDRLAGRSNGWRRLPGASAKWPWSVIRDPQMRRLASEVDAAQGSCQGGAMTTHHPTRLHPTTRLIWRG